MDASALEAQILALCKERRWNDIDMTLAAPLRHPDSMISGVSHMLLATARFQQSTAFVSDCLLLMDKAVNLLSNRPVELVKALLWGTHLADWNLDFERQELYCLKLRALFHQESAEVAKWNGRIFLRQGYYYHRTVGNLEKAEPWFWAAVTFHEANTGPYDEHDRRCHAGISLTALGDAQLELGRLDEAAVSLARARAFLDDATGHSIYEYVQARYCDAIGDWAAARDHYAAALETSHVKGDPVFSVRAAEMYCGFLVRSGDCSVVAPILKPLIRAFVDAEAPQMVLRLQRLLARSAGEVIKG